MNEKERSEQPQNRTDVTFSGRNERPQNRTDAKPCLSDVYKMSTRAKRRQTDVRLSGRSMVEMLGVLAIIGVLSVGAMSGYSKAMMKYKLNRQAEQLSTLINAGLRYAGTWNFTQDTMLVPYFIKLGEIPTEMTSNSKDIIYDVFGTAIYAAYTIAQNGSHYTQFFIRLDTTKNNTYISSICHNIINTIKEFHDQANLEYMSTLGFANDGGYFAYTYYGDAYCDGTNKCLKDMDIEQIESFCRYASGKDNSHIKLVWTE